MVLYLLPFRLVLVDFCSDLVVDLGNKVLDDIRSAGSVENRTPTNPKVIDIVFLLLLLSLSLGSLSRKDSDDN